MGSMDKETFVTIVDRQRHSGLSAKDFCANEGYSLSNFNYWKSKFGLTRGANRGNEFPAGLAPVRLSSQVNMHSSSDTTNSCRDEIMLHFPDGVQVHFRGGIQSEAALKLITQIYASHVLPE
jgi:putative transposase